jgi:LysM repeat protein
MLLSKETCTQCFYRNSYHAFTTFAIILHHLMSERRRRYREMKNYKKIALLLVVALLFTITACTRQASTSPITTPTAGNGEVPFPVDPEAPGDITDFATQTAVASDPQEIEPTSTPEIILATPEGQENDAGGGQEGVEATQAPQPAPEMAATPVVERPASYTLRQGEWPICIARRFNLDISTFFSLNNLSMQSRPAAGTVLRIPESGSWSASYGPRALRAHPSDYNVVAGDTVYSIACKFGDVAPESIMAVNNLSQPGDLQAGTTIRIP